MSQFTGVISSQFKSLFNDAIDELISSLFRTCKLIYPTTKWITCTECASTNLGNKGPNPFIHGGLGSHTGSCPVCKGEKKIPVLNEEEINLAVVWDYKDFFKIASNAVYPEGMVQTISNISIIEKLKKATHIIINTSIIEHANHKFVRTSEPSPIGLGTDRYIITNWKRE